MLFLHNILQSERLVEMMKKRYMRSLTALLTLGVLLLPTGCEEESPGTAKRAQEQRFFDLYMASTFMDTIEPPTASGLYYVEVTEGTGDIPDSADWLLVNYVGSTIPDDIVVDTYLENVARDNNIYSENAMYGPFKLLNGTRTLGLTEGLMLMRKGGEAILCFTSDLGYGSKGVDMMKSISGYRSLRYEVELLEVIKDMDAYEQAKIEAFVDTIAGADTIHDPVTDAVMYYVVDEEYPDSTQVANDSLVSVAYRGYLPDGREFDASSEGAPYEFPVGVYSDERAPILGWHLGLTRFRKGEKGRLIIPYQMAYGALGRVSGQYFAIQPYETLVFDIEVVSVGTDSGSDPGTDPQ